MKSELLAPPVIPPPAKQERIAIPSPKPVKTEPIIAADIMRVVRVTPCYKLNRKDPNKEYSHLDLRVVATGDENTIPRMRIKPGMLIKITTVNERKPGNGGNNAKG